MLTFESKVSAFEYWQTLAHLTDNTDTKPCKVNFMSECKCGSLATDSLGSL
jgi:hypothetical protein